MRSNFPEEPIPDGAKGHWRWTRFLHQPNTWLPALVCARLVLVLQHRPPLHRCRAPCDEDLPGRGGGPVACGRLGPAGSHRESAPTWDRWDEPPTLLRPKPGPRTDLQRT